MNFAAYISSIALIAFSLLAPSRSVQQNDSSTSSSQSSARSATKKSPVRSGPSQQEIADAKSKGLVWVNLSTRVYHRGGSLYGMTKRGKFMTEEDAKKAGYRAAKENENAKGTAAPSNPK